MATRQFEIEKREAEEEEAELKAAEELQEQIQKLTLIEANEFYVFEYIDPPAVMEKKSDPNRKLICIIGNS